MPTTQNTTQRRARPSEAGFMLVEVLMTALVVTVVGLGMFLGLEGASHGSGNNKHRSVASAIAQQDQDRMRAFKATDLSNYDAKRTVTVAGVAYSVRSTGDWVSDSSGAINCSNASQRANYLKITSAVSWQRMRVKPIRLESLVAPPPGSFNASQGNLVVRMVDQAQGPVTGVPVTLNSAANPTKSTESEGCVVFGAVAAGGYDLSYSLSGYVDPGGRTNVTDPVTVSASTTTTKTFQYALAGSIAVSFDTQVGSNPPQPSTARNLTVEHPNMPGATRPFSAAGGPGSTIAATSLFPFTSGYNVYAGSCPGAANPTLYDSTYHDTHPGLVTVAPGGSHSVTVRQPALNLAVTRGGSPLQGAHVVVKSTVQDCNETFDLPAATNAQGALPAPGFPFGKYSVCADDGTNKVTNPNVANTTPGGTATVPLQIPTTGSSGKCA